MDSIKKEISKHIDLTSEEERALQLDLVDDLFKELVGMERDLDKYNMEWVFNYAHERIVAVFDSEIKGALGCLKDEKKEEKSIVQETNKMIYKIASSIEKSTKSFNGAQTVTTISEIIGSFIIIMLSHEVTAYFVGHYSYLISTTVIVAIFAFFKIFIEKKYISKYNKKRQKRIYKSSLRKTRKAFIQMFLFYLGVKRFDKKYKDLNGELRHKKAVSFIKENHPRLDFI